MNWDKIKEAMKTGCVLVTFIKANGDKRVMECTLAEYLLPETLGGMNHLISNKAVCNVFDLENEGWRSFRYDSVTNVEIL
jgi:hypothetical protein